MDVISKISDHIDLYCIKFLIAIYLATLFNGFHIVVFSEFYSCILCNFYLGKCNNRNSKKKKKNVSRNLKFA